MQVRARYSTRNPGQLTGYAVALAGDTARAGGPVWFSGGKLAADLSLPKLRARWDGTSTPGQARAQFTPEERNAIWEHAARTAHEARDQIRLCAATDPAVAADVAWAASDTLHAAAAALGSRVIRQAADSYARAARVPYARIPRPTPAGTSLRQTARLMSHAALLGQNPAGAHTDLVTQLVALVEAIIELREAQRHAAQATAARRAAEHLHAERNGTPGGRRPGPPGRRGWPPRTSRSRPGPPPLAALLGRTSPPGPRPGQEPRAVPHHPGHADPPGDPATPAATVRSNTRRSREEAT